MERRKWSTYLLLTGLLLLFSRAAGRTTHGNSSHIAVPVEEIRFDQNSILNTSLVQTVPSDVKRRFVRNTPQGCNEDGHGIPCCPEYVTGDNVEGNEKEIIRFHPKTEANCQNTCKETYPTSIGVTIPVDNSKCFCEFATISLNEDDQRYKTCIFSTAKSGKAVFVGEGRRFEPNTVEISTNSIYASEPTQCCGLCQQSAADTSLYVFDTNSKQCFCRKQITGATLATHFLSTVVSGFCDAVFTECVKENDAFLTDRRSIKTVRSGGEDDCAKMCGESPECKFWHLQKSNNWCKLSKFSSRRRSSGYIAGTKSCGIGPPSPLNPTSISTAATIVRSPESNCDVNNCHDSQICQGGHCVNACIDHTCGGGYVCFAEGHEATCVWCTGDQHCRGNQKCDISNKNCVYVCSGHFCSGGNVCLAENHEATCVECTRDQHCNGNEKCDMSNKNCIDVCSGHSCIGWTVCLAEDHVATCVQCIDDQRCHGTEKCDIANKKCVDACSGHSCSGRGVCLAEDHVATCVGCTGDEHCYGNKKCDTSNNNCVECISNYDCTKEKKCQNNRCENVCTSNYCEDATRKYCISENHSPRCVNCRNSNDCKDEEMCYNKKCVSLCSYFNPCKNNANHKHCIAKNHKYICYNCTENDHCKEDEKCHSKQCKDVCTSSTCSGNPKKNCKASHHNYECVSCTSDDHCDQDKKCDPEIDECVDVCSDSQCGGTNTRCIPENHKPKCFCQDGYENIENTCKLITNWADWIDEGDCTAECGGGSQLRTRQCLDYQDNPLDVKECSGQGIQYKTCNTQYCGVTATSPTGDPSKIVDGDNSTSFTSAKGDYPWLQLEYTISREISGIRIELGEHQEPAALEDLEVRIGQVSISKMMDPQTVNTLCKISENVSTPVVQRTQIDIVCEKVLSGKFITVQKKLKNTELHIFKIELVIYCPESHPLASNNRDSCCSNSTNLKIECQDIEDCPDNLCISTNYIEAAAKNEENVSGLLFGVIGVLVLIPTVILVLLVIKKSSRTPKDTKTNKKHAVTIVEIQPLTADHIIIKKPTNKKVKDKEFLKALKNTAKNSGALKREFRALERLVAETIEVNKATTVGKLEENKARNRYRDMVPYDNNIVYLETPMGQPPSKYINASWITFPDDNQRYLAVQAPKANMFSSFWQLVWEKKVSTIVMITDLEEGGKIKAHQYWPDKDNVVMDIDNGITLHYIKHEFPGTYYSRQIEVKYKNQKRVVNQIQTTAWLDLTAPKDTKILLDLVYKAQELLDENPGPVLVHCSAGVGRTGTFVGLYHLIKDYENDDVKEIDFYKTVLRMREQRMKMVQKHPQYHYIAKCLADYVSAQESEYG